MSFHFSIAQNQEEKEVVFRFRQEVFTEEQGIPAELDRDGKDEDSFHLQAIEESTGLLVAIGRLTLNDGHGTLSRIAVHPDFRGKGLGKEIVRELEKLACGHGVVSLNLQPHAYLKAFYEDLGFSVVQGQRPTVGKYELLLMEKPL